MSGLRVKKGDVVFWEGTVSDCAFIIEKGSFEVTKKCGNGTNRLVGVLHASDIFGEMGLIDGRPRSATVTALEDGNVNVISKENFERLAQKSPETLMPLLKVLSTRLRETLERASA